ncbi:HAD-IA family hydrolase [Candidatus Nomurabacteria bacterium]|nr:HAD-IA family hydrolase [Candidatus Nomurabacteria bacterium]
MKIKLIIFDLSNVCFNAEEPIFIDDFCEKYDLDKEKFESEYLALIERSEIGEISGKELWRQLLGKYEVEGDPEKIIEDMMKEKFAYEDTLNIVQALKRSGCKVVYLTNYNEDYWSEVARKWDLSEYFLDGIVSYQIKARKPSKEGFMKLVDRFGAKSKETLFIDDSRGNIEKAGDLGINTYHFDNAENLKSFLIENKLL